MPRPDGWVVGCVWGARRRLLTALGEDAPDYAWCEEQWQAHRRLDPGEKERAEWLAGLLLDLWLNGAAAPVQLDLFATTRG